MHLGRLTVCTVDRDHVLRAGRHDYDTIHDRTKRHLIPGLAERLSPDDFAIGADRDVHPQVQRGRAVGCAQVDLAKRRMQIVGAIVVILAAAQCCVSVDIAGRDDRIVATGGGIFLQHQDRPPPVCGQAIALCREDTLQRCVQVLHRHEFGQIICIEAPGIDDLLTVRIDDLDRLTFCQPNCATASCGYHLKVVGHCEVPLLLAR